jgi:hypothetical protein
MVASLKINCLVASLKAVFAEVYSIVACADARPEGNSCEHKCPVSEGQEEAVEVHVEEISHVTHQSQTKHQVSHSLCSIDLSLLIHLLLAAEVLKLSELIILVRIILGGNVVDIVWPVLIEVCEVYLLVLLILHSFKIL